MDKIQLENITGIRGDCMDYLRDTPDKYYDLAIVDPPYGIGEDGGKSESRCRKTGVRPSTYKKRNGMRLLQNTHTL